MSAMLWYTCYDPDADEVLSTGSAKGCAEGLGLSVSTLYSYVSRARAGHYCPYTFVIEDTRTGKMTTLHGSKRKGAVP